MRSQNLLFYYLAWWYSSWYFRGEKYLVDSQSRSWNQACNPAWSMGQGEGDFGFLPYWCFLIIYQQVPGKCLFVKTVQSVDRNPAGNVSCGGSGCIFLLPLRIVLHTLQWQPLCVAWSWCTSLILTKDAGRNRAWKSKCSISRDSETLNQQGIWKSFYKHFLLLFFFFSSHV